MKWVTTVEGRVLGKDDLKEETSEMPTEHQMSTATKLARIAWLSKRDRSKKFSCLMHHFNEEALEACFHELDGKKAVGADQVTKEEYGVKLGENLRDLLERMKRMAYRPGPVRRVLIPKDGKPGATRPLGISNFEDKLVQKMTAKILEAIYEPTFRDCSYGFRPGLGCHDAIRGLHQHLFANHVDVVIDVDLANFFGSVRSEVVKLILEERIADRRFIRYVMRMMKAGVLSDGDLVIGEEGLPQGSPCAPILANIVAHHVIDEWFEEVVKRHCRGRVELYRYCDDAVICCQSAYDGERIRTALGKRLSKYGLALNEEKTKLVNFSRSNYARGKHQGSFDFLGFSFYLARSRRGNVIPKLRTSRKRLRSKLKRVNKWAAHVRSRHRMRDIWTVFIAKLRGHMAYYAVSFNFGAVQVFFEEATRILFYWLNRRGGKRRLTWEKFQFFMHDFPLPPIVIHHSLVKITT